MPIKFPKTFNRRKSSVTAPEPDNDSAPPAQSSFRILERPPDATKSFDGPDKLKRGVVRRPKTSPTQQARRQSYGAGSESSNRQAPSLPAAFVDHSLTIRRGSGNTNSSGDAFSTNRFSYASTVPSSVDSISQDDLPLKPRDPQSFNYHGSADSPLPNPADQYHKSSFSIRAAGRALSYGPKTTKAIGKENNAGPAIQTRHRTMTESSYTSGSTATPPKIDLGGPDLGMGGSDFGDMFKRKSAILEEKDLPPAAPPRSTPDPAMASAEHDTQQAQSVPDYRADAFSKLPEPSPRRIGSPYSWRSNESQERLMSSPREPPRSYSPGKKNSFDRSPGFAGDNDAQVVMDAVFASRALEAELAPTALKSSQTDPNLAQSGSLGSPVQNSSNASYRPNAPVTTHNNFRRPPSAWVGRESSRGMFGSRDVDGLGLEVTSKQRNMNSEDEPLFDAPQSASLARSNLRASALPKQQPNKVMTPAEFEQYKHQKEEASQDDDNKSEQSSESETYEDDDEAERTRQMARQRRRQEAHLAVYRQQMMKVTGEQPSSLPELPRRAPLERASQSAPNFLTSLSFDKPSEGEQPATSKRSSDDEDDEIPLGVLQAHGFPSKSRPPSQVARNSSGPIPRPQSQATSYPPPPGSTRNDPSTGGGGALPAFAKNLPTDPYVGASLVNAPVRESLGYNQNGAANPPQPAPPQNLPPGGLVGVIAGEERAKAMRRGSPNARGTYDALPPQQSPFTQMQQQMLQQMPPQTSMPGMNLPMASMPPMAMQQPITPGEQSQINMNNQMAQMMQMQMQWMQQMMQMQNGQQPNSQQPPHIPQPQFPSQTGFLSPPDSNVRPSSHGSGGSSPGEHQRGMSGMAGNSRASYAPSMNMMAGMPPSSGQSVYGMPTPGPGYAPSIAPSERSNVGQPSRYRPVTPAVGINAGINQQTRTSTMSAHTVQGLGGQREFSNAKTRGVSQVRAKSMDGPTALQKSTIRAIDKPKHGGGGSDDDEEEGWAEIQKKRQDRQSRWKSSKVNKEVMPGQQEGGLEGLYYQGYQG